jgi:cytochrome c oxidase subunit 2
MDYAYDSIIVNDDDLIKGSRRLLETDKVLVLPYNTIIRFLISSTDVLHA